MHANPLQGSSPTICCIPPLALVVPVFWEVLFSPFCWRGDCTSIHGFVSLLWSYRCCRLWRGTLMDSFYWVFLVLGSINILICWWVPFSVLFEGGKLPWLPISQSPWRFLGSTLFYSLYVVPTQVCVLSCSICTLRFVLLIMLFEEKYTLTWLCMMSCWLDCFYYYYQNTCTFPLPVHHNLYLALLPDGGGFIFLIHPCCSFLEGVDMFEHATIQFLCYIILSLFLPFLSSFPVHSHP